MCALSPTLSDDHFFYLGLTVHRNTDRLSVRSRPIQLKSRLKGCVDITLRNMGEVRNFLKLGRFTKSHLASVCSGIYCPQNHLDAIFSNIARTIQCYILNDTEIALTWSSKLDSKYFNVLEKLTELYFKVQHLSIP